MTLIYPGSFDPVTTGHIDIAQRGAKLADRLIIAVLDNPNKKTLFTVAERVELLKDAFKSDIKIEVDSFSGLLAEYAVIRGANAILRGLRSPTDFESEARYAAYNKMLTGAEPHLDGIDTIYLPASPHLAFISSSIVREVAAHTPDINGNNVISSMITPVARVALIEKFGRMK